MLVEPWSFLLSLSLVCHIDLCCSHSGSPVCFSRTWQFMEYKFNIIDYLFTSDMSAVLVKGFKPLSSLQVVCEQAVVADDGFKNNLLVSDKICWLVPRNSSL